jgi:hypothetical protein
VTGFFMSGRYFSASFRLIQMPIDAVSDMKIDSGFCIE